MRNLVGLCAMLASLLGVTATAMTPEEAAVRNAYARLSYAVDIETVYRVTSANRDISSADLAQQVAQRGLSFKLSDFTVGNVSDIADANYLDHFSQYNSGQEVIQTTLKTHNYIEDGATTSMQAIEVKWGPGPTLHGTDDPLLNYTVKQAVPVIEEELHVPSVVRYCTYTVTASLEGRSRTYKAVFFFGSNNEVAPVDPTVGTTGNDLQYFILHPVFPNILLLTNVASLPAVHEFLAANQQTASSCKSGDACCDAETLRCGVLSSDLGRRP
jgi:hypothetical protein